MLRRAVHGGGRRNAIGVEVDAGAVLLSNSSGSGSQNLFKADSTTLYNASGNATGPFPASLSISNNSFPGTTLYMANAGASATTRGCGNDFAVPTPYLCAPSSFTQLPGGRLTLSFG